MLSSEYQIELDDLMISTRHNSRVKLRSLKHDKEVIPCLTVAHNYSNAALPIYQFLANVSSQQRRISIGFSWPQVFEEYDYLPRVEYHDVIVAKATWNIRHQEIADILEQMDDVHMLYEISSSFFQSRNIPQYVLLVDGDNELLVNTKNITSICMLLDTVKKRDKFQLKEFLHNSNGPVKEGKDSYANQVIVSFYNEKKLKHTNG